MASVLIVEDDQVIREAYELVFARHGYAVDSADTGTRALELAIDGKPDLILLDMLLPELSGIEFLRAYQPNRASHTKIVALTNIEDRRQQAYELGADEYMIKASISPRQIVGHVQKVMGIV